MDNLQYLSQISSSTPPSYVPKQPLFSGKLKTILIIAAVLILGLFIFGLTSSSETPTDSLVELNLHATSLTDTVDSFRPSVKSTKLRSDSASLTALLGNISSLLSTQNLPKPTESQESAEESKISELNSTLTFAKLNGYLDRVYAREFTLETTLLISMLRDASADSSDSSFQASLASIISSLETLNTSFANFSEVK